MKGREWTNIMVSSTRCLTNFNCGKMHKMFAQFFWSKSVGGKSRHWTSWDTLCQPCEEGEIQVHLINLGVSALSDLPIRDFRVHLPTSAGLGVPFYPILPCFFMFLDRV
uniref:Uncharacterized protein LOC104236775 n=1 Tax=Nicotiana sylvestris TaxID=4096 RepID=A0A1U7XRI3_NICSY|nr:PREDICTED: uncharacterized protein LOC104236775 [Nicotiana sylvestris]